MININDIKYSVDQCMKSDYMFSIKVVKPYCNKCYNYLHDKKTCNNCGYYNEDKEIKFLNEDELLNILRKEKIKKLVNINNRCNFHDICSLWRDNKCNAIKCEYKKI